MSTGFNLAQIYYVAKCISKSPYKANIWAVHWQEANNHGVYDQAIVLAMGAIIFHVPPKMFMEQFQSVPSDTKKLAEDMYIHSRMEHFNQKMDTLEVSNIQSPDAYTNIFFTEKTRKEAKEWREAKALTYVGPRFIRPKRLKPKEAFAH